MLELEPISRTETTTIANLLDAFHEHNILYCNWKSNEHLHASMAAEADFDLLIDESQKHQTTQLLEEFGFKLFDAVKPRRYKDIVDFIGLDDNRGKLIHLHTHYQLTLGEHYLKSYQLPWSTELLNNRVFNEDYKIYCCSPEIELILLYVREALKQRNRDELFMYLKNRVELNDCVLREYKWLKEKVNETDLYKQLQNLFSNPEQVYGLMNQPFDRRTLSRLAALLKRDFSRLRFYAPQIALMIRWYREAYLTIVNKVGHSQNLPIPTKRINKRGGLVVALIGADGSGKSTAAMELRKTFEQKLDVYSIYFGRGDGKVSWFRKQLQRLKNFIKRDKQSKARDESSPKRPQGFGRTFYKCMIALLVAREKMNNLKRMQLARSKGMLVICDRFPQNQFFGYDDGPLLHPLVSSKNPLFRYSAKLESNVYKTTERIQPDIVFKLIADARIVEKRKPGETSYEKLVEKIEGIKQLKFEKARKVITIDATRPMKSVHAFIKNEIWKML